MSLLPKTINKSWEKFLTKDIIDELTIIESKIGNNYFPNTENVLRFMELDLNEIKYIIVGMEPYPSSFEKSGKIIPEATGRSFEIKSLLSKTWSDKFKQSSLRNILKTIYYNKTNEIIDLETLRKKIEQKEFEIKNPKEWFNNIEAQGVMFLNATLTVEAYNVDSHRKIWETFMIKLISYIEKNSNVKWVLWGKPAQERIIPYIKDNYIISCHPRLNDFIKENCFAKMKDINWCGGN